MQTTTTTRNTENVEQRRTRPTSDAIRKALTKRSFATLATTSGADRPHVAGVLYEIAGGTFYINTMRTSRKARNIAANAHVGVCVPVRRLPVGPPSTIHFQATAELVNLDAAEIVGLIANGKLTSLTSHGELDMPDGCFVRITPPTRMLTYGLGMSLRQLIADPLGASSSVDGICWGHDTPA